VRAPHASSQPSLPTCPHPIPPPLSPVAQLPASDARVVNLQLAPQGVVRLMWPLKGNEAAIGLDQLRDPVRRPAALKTIASGKMTMQGPMMLKQGFLGVIPRLPIFIANVTDPMETFGWAFWAVRRGGVGRGAQ
jgi:sensor domain CHASE-containing protein